MPKEDNEIAADPNVVIDYAIATIKRLSKVDVDVYDKMDEDRLKTVEQSFELIQAAQARLIREMNKK